MKPVLHIGAPKTGTTAIQDAVLQIDSGEGGLAAFGVSLPGTPLAQARAALSVLGQGVGWSPSETAVGPKPWARLVARSQAATGTVFVSSEYLCEAQPETIQRIVDDLGEDLQVVLTLRPLGQILPSAWQQYLKSGHQLPYEKWLRAMLSEPPKGTVTPSFWRRHDQAAVVERWAGVVGAERMSVVVLDPLDRRLLFRAFESLLGLPPATLGLDSSSRHNRSMTASEAELFRRLNSITRRQKFPWEDYAELVRYGAILRTVERHVPKPDEAGLVTPAWAVERAAELGQEYVERIGALLGSGLQVVGDLAALAEPAVQKSDAGPAPNLLPMDVAVEAVLGTLLRASTGVAFFADEVDALGDDVRGMPGSGRDIVVPVGVDQLTSRQLVAVLAGRVRAGLARRWRRLATRFM